MSRSQTPQMTLSADIRSELSLFNQDRGLIRYCVLNHYIAPERECRQRLPAAPVYTVHDLYIETASLNVADRQEILVRLHRLLFEPLDRVSP